MRAYLPHIGVLCLIIAGFLYTTSDQPRESFKAHIQPAVKPVNTTERFIPPADWKTYTDSSFGYMIRFPKDFVVEENGKNSIMVLKDAIPMGVGPTNFIYISVVTPDKLASEGEVYNYNRRDWEQLNNLSISESASFGDIRELYPYFSYRRFPDKEIGETIAKQFVNEKPWEFPEGTKETRFIFENNNRIFLIGAYINPETTAIHGLSGELFNNILTTFTLQ